MSPHALFSEVLPFYPRMPASSLVPRLLELHPDLRPVGQNHPSFRIPLH